MKKERLLSDVKAEKRELEIQRRIDLAVYNAKFDVYSQIEIALEKLIKEK